MPSAVPARLVRTKSDEAAIDQGCWFDQAAADRVRHFFDRFLRHSKGPFAGRRFELQPWQWGEFVEPAFGWKMPDGTRRFRRIGIAVPKKNGKSTLLAGIGLYLMLADGEMGAEIYSAAADRKQASIIYNEAANMVEASPAFMKRIALRRASKSMYAPGTRSSYDALSAEVNTKEGYNAHAVLFDELHAQKTPALWNVLRFAGAARRQPMIIWITTAGVDRESICWLQWQNAKAVRDGRAIDIGLLPVIYEADEGDDPYSEATWRKVNPSYGVTFSERDMREAAEEAKSNPALENAFKRYRLNMWTRQESRWIPVERWDACKVDYVDRELRRHRCIAGLDLATTTDLNAFVLLFRHGLKYRVLPYFWAPEAALRSRERANRQRIDHWANAGFITLTSGNCVDYDVIRRDIGRLADRFDVEEVSVDPWNATSLVTGLQSDGMKVVYTRTGFYTMSPAAKEFEKLVSNGTIEHNGNPVLDWMFGNVCVETDASGNIKPSKKLATEKIDGIVALLLALARVIAKAEPKQSVYQHRGVKTL